MKPRELLLEIYDNLMNNDVLPQPDKQVYRRWYQGKDPRHLSQQFGHEVLAKAAKYVTDIKELAQTSSTSLSSRNTIHGSSYIIGRLGQRLGLSGEKVLEPGFYIVEKHHAFGRRVVAGPFESEEQGAAWTAGKLQSDHEASQTMMVHTSSPGDFGGVETAGYNDVHEGLLDEIRDVDLNKIPFPRSIESGYAKTAEEGLDLALQMARENEPRANVWDIWHSAQMIIQDWAGREITHELADVMINVLSEREPYRPFFVATGGVYGKMATEDGKLEKRDEFTYSELRDMPDYNRDQFERWAEDRGWVDLPGHEIWIGPTHRDYKELGLMEKRRLQQEALDAGAATSTDEYEPPEGQEDVEVDKKLGNAMGDLADAITKGSSEEAERNKPGSQEKLPFSFYEENEKTVEEMLGSGQVFSGPPIERGEKVPGQDYESYLDDMLKALNNE